MVAAPAARALAALEGRTMRKYATLAPSFWTGTTGQALAREGPLVQLLALYLVTNPHATMLGLYYVPRPYIVHDTGRTQLEVDEGLAGCCRVDFATVDGPWVWVRQMVCWQTSGLKAGDKRRQGIVNAWLALPDNPLLVPFWNQHGQQYGLPERRCKAAPEHHGSPIEAPTKGQRYQGQDQEQEQGQDQEQPDQTSDAGVLVRGPADSRPNSGKTFRQKAEALVRWMQGTAHEKRGVYPPRFNGVVERIEKLALDVGEDTVREVWQQFLDERKDLKTVSLRLFTDNFDVYVDRTVETMNKEEPKP